MKKGFTLVEIMIVLAIIGLIVAIAIPAFLKNRQDAQGQACNGQLDQIYSAKEQIAFKLNVRPGGDAITVDPADIDVYLRGMALSDGNDRCPGGGTYDWDELYDTTTGMVAVPECNWRDEGSNDTLTYEAEGLHIHRRSYEQVDGAYTKLLTVTFCGD